MLQETFGDDVAELVDGVTKISRYAYVSKEEQQAETFRKMLLAMVGDLRVVLVKLADRLHNMRTLEFLPEERQLSIAKETMEIYAPIANRLGIGRVKNELEDLSFRYLHPREFEELHAPGRDIFNRFPAVVHEPRQRQRIVREEERHSRLAIQRGVTLVPRGRHDAE